MFADNSIYLLGTDTSFASLLAYNVTVSVHSNENTDLFMAYAPKLCSLILVLWH